MTERRAFCLVTLVLAASLAPPVIVSAEDKAAAPSRAKPPEWSRDVLDAFFDDAREQLVGPRPAAAVSSIADAPPPADPAAPSVAGKYAWSKLIEGDTLATEVKRVVAGLAEPLSNPAKFKAGGYQQCRLDFSVLAVLFAVIAEHDGDVRWQDDAPALRQALARAGLNCKTATDQTFAEAQSRKTDLDDVIRGERLASSEAGESAKWSDVADRTLLMQRMQLALEERLSPKLGGEAVFKKSLGDVRHEAELLAMLAEIIQREDYEYWDDDTFREYSTELRTAAQEMARAAADEDYEAARAAAGRASQACASCHEGYRG
jgi:hypothetical protein